MKTFTQGEFREAEAHAVAGGQALHLHRIITPRAPNCFKAAIARDEDIAHLFDRDEARLRATARTLGVRVIVIDRKGTTTQHIDLCGAPLKKALALAANNGPMC
jgi:uncharacterized protein (DUF58 family)